MKKILLLLLLPLLTLSTVAQNYNMSNTTITTCGGTFYDPQGTGNYINNQGLITMTICSNNGGPVSLNFTGLPFQVETGFDFLRIYNGTGTGGTMLWNSQTAGGATNPGVITSTGSCLTITWSSDGSVTYTGWQALIQCPSCTNGIQDGAETGIDCGGPTCPTCPNCFNGIQDGSETGIDCGPACPEPCHCNNGILDGNETDVDCGGSCNPCPEPCNVTLNYTTPTYNPPPTGGPAYTMTSGTISTCGGTFYDPGGPSANYGNNNFNTQTFCSSTPGGQLQFVFTQWNLETCCDYLTVYDGPTASGAQLFNGNGSTNPGTITSTNGCLTFVWDSDGSVVGAGWTAIINCVNVPMPLDCNGGDIILTAEGQGEYVLVLNNDFDGGNAGTGWSTNITASYSNPCDPSVDGGTYMWMGNSSPHPRIISTVPLDVSCGGEVCFYLDFATQGNPSPCEGIDEPDEGVYFEYSTNGGATWVTIEYYGPAGVGNSTASGGNNAQMTAWNQYCLTIPPAAMTNSTLFHWAQTGSSGNNNDHWGLDNVTISSLANCTPYWYDYSYLPPSSDNPIQNTTVSGTTTYTVTYTNGTDACSTSLTINLPSGTTADAGPDVTICSGGPAVTIGANPVTTDNGATYSWNNGAGSGTIDLTAPGITNGQVSVAPALTTTYTLSVTNNGCTDTDDVTVTIDAPPTGSNPAPINVQCAANIPAPDPTVVIDEADAITNPPTVTWISDVSNGATCPEIITRTYRITDACGNFINVTQTITVDDTTPPTASNPAPINLPSGSAPAPDVTVVIDEADNCSAPTVAWVSDVSDGGICPEIVTRTYSVTDLCGNQIQVTQTITLGDGIFPTGSNPAPVTVQCAANVPSPDPTVVTDEADNGATPSVTWISDVSDGGSCPEIITRTYRITDACGNFIEVVQTITIDDTTPPTASNPAGISVPGGPAPLPDPTVVNNEADNCSVPVVAWVSDVSDGGNCPEIITRTYSVTDLCGNQILVTQPITIGDPVIPTASNPATVTVECIGDVPAPDPIVVIDEADNGATPTVAWEDDTPNGASCPLTIARRYRVTDDCGNFIFVTQSIIVDDITAPSATAPAPITVLCIADVPAPDATLITNETDNCTAAPVVAFVGDIAGGTTCPITITRTYSVTDACGNQTLVNQTIVVNDIAAPTGTAPSGINVECFSAIPAANVALVTNVSDNCTANPVIAFVGDVSDGNSCPETITRTYSVTDDCGNETLLTQSIIVNDITPPTASNLQAVNVECVGDIPAVNIADVNDESDNCNPPVVAWVGDVSDGNTCPETITRTYSVTDDCGNTINVTQTIVVNDITPPVASNPVNISVPGVNDVPAPDITDVVGETDNCTAAPLVTWISDVSDGNTCNLEEITRTYSITDDCGNQTIVTQVITILAVYPPLDAGADQSVCEGEDVVLTALNPLSAPIQWTNNVINGVAFTPASTATYTVTANNLGCISTDDVTVTVNPNPAVNFVADTSGGCIPLTVNFTNLTAGAVDCVWSISDGSLLTGCNTVTNVFDQVGCFDVTLTTTSANGCTSTLTAANMICTEGPPDAAFAPSQNNVSSLDAEIEFLNNTTGADSYVWDFGDGSPLTTEEEPSHTYTETDAYFQVMLIATSPLGCVDTTYSTIHVYEELIYYIPNTFTPDQDQFNNTFQPVFTSGYDPFDFELLIFNRWGELIFESHNAAIGWDGSYGGKLVQDGTYTWRIEFKISANDKRVIDTGHVNMIR